MRCAAALDAFIIAKYLRFNVSSFKERTQQLCVFFVLSVVRSYLFFKDCLLVVSVNKIKKINTICWIHLVKCCTIQKLFVYSCVWCVQNIFNVDAPNDRKDADGEWMMLCAIHEKLNHMHFKLPRWKALFKLGLEQKQLSNWFLLVAFGFRSFSPLMGKGAQTIQLIQHIQCTMYVFCVPCTRQCVLVLYIPCEVEVYVLNKMCMNNLQRWTYCMAICAFIFLLNKAKPR